MANVAPENDQTDTTYTRLQGRPYRLISIAGEYHELWLARDHLLSVRGNLLEERYRRIRFADVMALTRKPSPYRFIANTILLAFAGAVSLLFLLILFTFMNDPFMDEYTPYYILFVWTIVLLPVFFLLLRNNLLGPTCKCRIHTDVQSLDLPSLYRVRDAEAVLFYLTSSIERVQGRVPSETARERLDAGAVRQRTSDTVSSMYQQPMEGTSRLTWERTAFILCLAYGALLMMLLSLPTEDNIAVWFLWTIEAVLHLTLIGVAVAAVVSHQRWHTPPFIRTLIWLIIAGGILSTWVVQGIAPIMLFFPAFLFDDFSSVDYLVPRADVAASIFGLSIVISLALGIAGLVAIAIHRSNESAPAQDTAGAAKESDEETL